MESNKDLDYRAILNAIPLMIFVVDEDVRVYDLNEAAVTVFGPDKATILNRRPCFERSGLIPRFPPVA